jgi:CheY-like chemotaxis protein
VDSVSGVSNSPGNSAFPSSATNFTAAAPYMKPTNPIVFVDDDKDDRLIFSECFRESGCSREFLEFESGIAFLEYLNAASPEQLPEMVLLDLNMPVMDGRQILSEIKKTKRFQQIPVIIFTTSNFDKDRTIAYNLGANCFLTKPSTYHEILGITRAIATLWCLTD